MDSKRFPDSSGWGYALFNYNAASEAFTPDGSGNNCGYKAHTIVKAKDYIFRLYRRWRTRILRAQPTIPAALSIGRGNNDKKGG